MHRALITGITGQDGSYLAQLLASKGYEIHGTVRYNAQAPGHNQQILMEQIPEMKLHLADLADVASLSRLIEKVEPDEVYNLAAQSFVTASFAMPEATIDVTGVGPARLLEAIRNVNPRIRFYQASTSEMFGKVTETLQCETTPFHPRSPYGVAKLFAFWITVNYRESFGIHASNGILFNHESPRRGEAFVTRKITRSIARIVVGKQSKLVLGNLDSKRDWGHARDYVEAMWLMLQQPAAEDYVIATGENHSVREFLEVAFTTAGLNWLDFVESDPGLFRIAEVDFLRGDSSKARKILGWKPCHTFKQLVEEMVREDLLLEGIELANIQENIKYGRRKLRLSDVTR